MARSEARMYTATHMVLFNSLVRRLECPKHAGTAGERVRSLCSGIFSEAESLHTQLENSANNPHCLTDLWLEQSKADLPLLLNWKYSIQAEDFMLLHRQTSTESIILTPAFLCHKDTA